MVFIFSVLLINQAPSRWCGSRLRFLPKKYIPLHIRRIRDLWGLRRRPHRKGQLATYTRNEDKLREHHHVGLRAQIL